MQGFKQKIKNIIIHFTINVTVITNISVLVSIFVVSLLLEIVIGQLRQLGSQTQIATCKHWYPTAVLFLQTFCFACSIMKSKCYRLSKIRIDVSRF